MLKRILLLVAVSLMLTPLASAQADAKDGVFCGALSEADCQILLTNAEVMEGVYALRFDMALEMSLQGAGLDEEFDMSGVAGGSFAVDPATADALALAFEAPDGDLAALLEAVLAAIEGDVFLSLGGTAGEEAVEMDLNLVFKDGVILFGAGAMEELTGQPMEGIEWFGVDTSGALGDLLADAGLASLTDLTGMPSPTKDEAEAQATNVTRLADEAVAGVPVAVFESNIDANSLLAALTLEDIQAEVGSDQEVNAEEALAVARSMDVRSLASRHYIGIADHFSYRMEMVIDLALDGESVGAGYGDINLIMNIDIYLSEFNQPVNVEIPEEAFVLPLAMMLQMGSQ